MTALIDEVCIDTTIQQYTISATVTLSLVLPNHHTLLIRRLLPYTAIYRAILLPSIIITLACVWLCISTDISAIGPNTMMKLVTIPVLLLFANYRKRKEYYYYYNLGISKQQLLTTAILIDVLIYIVLMLVGYLFIAPNAATV